MITDTFGVNVNIKMGVDMTAATSAEVVVVGPAKQRVVKTGPAVTISDAKNGIVTYVTEDGDFTRKGVYKLQAIVYFGASRKLRSEVVEIDTDAAL